MAIVKLAPLAAVFLLAALLIFPMKKVEAQCTGGACNDSCDYSKCICMPFPGFFWACVPKKSVDLKKLVEDQDSKICESHADCIKKDSGNFCGRKPYSGQKYGWCFGSISEAADMFFKTTSNSEFKTDFLKMPGTTA